MEAEDGIKSAAHMGAAGWSATNSTVKLQGSSPAPAGLSFDVPASSNKDSTTRQTTNQNCAELTFRLSVFVPEFRQCNVTKGLIT